MTNSRVWLLALLIGVLSNSIVAWGADLRLLAERLWSSKTEQEGHEVYKEIEALPVEAYKSLLLNVYRSPNYQDNEAAPYLAAVVYHYYLKKENGTNVTVALFDVIRNENTPMNLKRDLLRDITTWYKGPLEVAVKECSDFNYETNKDIWLAGQYAVAKLIQANHRADAINLRQIDDIAESCLSNSLVRLVASFKEEQRMNWPAKTLATFRKVLGPRFDKMFIESLRNDRGPRSRRLSLLAGICGWGERSEDVLDYLKEIKNEFAREGDQSNKQERAVIEKLIKVHEDPAK